MSLWAICLIVVSALLHAGWNLLSKSNKSSGTAFFLSSSAAASLILAPFVTWYLLQVGWTQLPLTFFWFLLFSGAAQVVYLIGLGHAYKHGDIGVIYPIARALPVLMVGVGTAIIGQVLPVQVWLGFVLITFGCLIVPLSSLRELSIKEYCSLGVIWALIAALGTTGYSILDKEALNLLNVSALEGVTSLDSAIFYLGVQFWVIFVVITAYVAVTRQWTEFSQAWQIRKPSAMAGLMMLTTYGLVLYAMTMTTNVSYVVALRQLSIVFGLVFGVAFLGEKLAMTRLLGTGMIFAGLVLTVL